MTDAAARSISLVIALAAGRAGAEPTAAIAGWDDGFFLRTADGASRVSLGGYSQFDGRFFIDDGADPHVDQFGFRSIRPELKGTVLDHYDFRVLPDFAAGAIALQDAYVDVRFTEVA